MDIQTRKYQFIEGFIRLSNLKIIEKLETVLKKEKQIEFEKTLIPMTKEELIARDQFSNEDIKVGNVISQNDLKEESKSW
ncbi:MAG: hypothetical protein H8D45_17570 [Bacteroidetes bacterium]|nr:hypothetical protein [Bacteroidota bacterium]MBL7102998.1 hypothetical protein [Bacteroidales bacterium]